jgi:tetratricopeptide (TPR) repeat protein
MVASPPTGLVRQVSECITTSDPATTHDAKGALSGAFCFNLGEMNTQDLEALLQEARQATREKDSPKVIEVCEQALELAPDDVGFTFMYGVALRREGQLDAAEPRLRKLIEAAPQLSAAHRELGLLRLAQGRLSEARAALERAVQLDPKDSGAWRVLRDVRAAEGDDAGAAEAYRQALGSSEQDPAIQKALELFGKGRLGIAEGICREFLRQNPLDVNAIRLLAEIGIRLGVQDEATGLLERCLELAPDFHVARANYATALSQQQRFPEALEQMHRLVKEQPDNISHRVQRASILSMSGDYESAHARFEEVLETVPDNARILTSYGHSLRYGGKGAEAIDAYQRAIAADPGAGEPYWSLANLKTFRFSDEQVVDMRARLESLSNPSADKYHLAFALGKALEDSGNYEDSFKAYETGNDIKKQTSAYEHERTTWRVDASIEHIDRDLFDGSGHRSNEPIFIVGLPRAGSTLLEQILSSHSQVEATTELPFIGQIAADLSETRKKSEESKYPAILTELSSTKRQELGQQYLDGAAVYRKGAPRFIDKLPNNFLHIALIKSILPNATIVDVRREPMAACFANFKQLFARGQEYTYSLEDLGHYYADYLRLMSHWYSVLPNEVLTVQYEEVVADLETQVDSLLEHCNLEFEESCIRFHETDRAVRTPSSEQVRQPIYRDALTQWQRYSDHLQPVKQILEERGVL